MKFKVAISEKHTNSNEYALSQISQNFDIQVILIKNAC